MFGNIVTQLRISAADPIYSMSANKAAKINHTGYVGWDPSAPFHFPPGPKADGTFYEKGVNTMQKPDQIFILLPGW